MNCRVTNGPINRCAIVPPLDGAALNIAIHIGRREFIVALGGMMAALPLAARTPRTARRIGVLIEFDETDPEAKAWLRPEHGR
jgi:hypothetical protein